MNTNETVDWVKPMVDEFMHKAYNQGVEACILTTKLFYERVQSDCPATLISQLEELIKP